MTDSGSVLLVEDERGLHDALRLNLELEGYEVTSAFNGSDAIRFCQEGYFDLIILDIMLPGVDGLTVLETIKLHKVDSPVLILSARSTSTDRVTGLRKGADDYLTKPFELEELILRVQNLMSKSKALRSLKPLSEKYSFGGHTVDFKSQVATLKSGETVELSKKESMLLQLLITNANEVVTREKILQAIILFCRSGSILKKIAVTQNTSIR
ncbi:MAG: response regulator transcription factor [Chitinophagaceae bacterium]|nr:response regulator transcription factor [Chitinophagaceae bacterium]